MRPAGTILLCLLALSGCGGEPPDDPLVLETQEALDSASAAAPPTLIESTVHRARHSVDAVNSRIQTVDSLLNR